MGLEKWELWENLTISNDFMFSKVMRDKEICRETLEILLDKKIGEITYIDNQKMIDINYDSKSVRLDVYVEDENRIYNIEMQVVNNKDLGRRSRYYQGMIDLNAIEKGELYRDLKDSIIIFICKFDPFGEGLPRYTFENICEENKEVYLGDGTSKVFFNTKDYDKEKREEVKYFLEYVERDIARENGFVKRIEKKVRDVKENKEWEVEYMKSLIREQEIARDNFEKGKIEGIKEGKIEGIEEGREEESENSIRTLVEVYRELDFKDENIVKKLKEKYNLTEEEAEKYLR